MNHLRPKSEKSLLRRIFALFAIITLAVSSILPSPVFADTVLSLPEPGTLIKRSEAYVPVILRGVKLDPDNPLRLNFIFDSGNTKWPIGSQEFRDEAMKSIQYFMASLTLPEDELWVNLSPNEPKRMVPRALGRTVMSRDMLAQDYLLKQITASLTHPDEMTGRRFWAEVYARSSDKLQTTTTPVNAFNKVWIVPNHAEVYEAGAEGYILDRHLQVMLEQDYLATREALVVDGKSIDEAKEKVANDAQAQADEIARTVMRDVVLPELEQEVNEGKNFAAVRQIYNAMILATWFKQKLQQSLIARAYADQKKVSGIDLDDKGVNQEIYEQYMAAFRKGVYNVIRNKEEPTTGTLVPRKYFSGGLAPLAFSRIQMRHARSAGVNRLGPTKPFTGVAVEIGVDAQPVPSVTIPVVTANTAVVGRLAPTEAVSRGDFTSEQLLALIDDSETPGGKISEVSAVSPGAVLALNFLAQVTRNDEEGRRIVGQVSALLENGRVTYAALPDNTDIASLVYADADGNARVLLNTAVSANLLTAQEQAVTLVVSAQELFPNLRIPIPSVSQQGPRIVDIREVPQLQTWLRQAMLQIQEQWLVAIREVQAQSEANRKFLRNFLTALATPVNERTPEQRALIAATGREVPLNTASVPLAAVADQVQREQALTGREDVIDGLLNGTLNESPVAGQLDALLLTAAAAFPENLSGESPLALDDAEVRSLTQSLRKEAVFKNRFSGEELSPDQARRELALVAFMQTPDVPEEQLQVKPGGIDFNPDMLSLQLLRDADGHPLPFMDQPLLQIEIDGFRPMIMDIAPVELPAPLSAAQPLARNME